MKKLFNSQTILYLIPFIIVVLITIFVFIVHLTDSYFPGPGITTNDFIAFIIIYGTILLELMACAINVIWGLIAWIVFSIKKKNSYKARKKIIVALIGACLLIIILFLIQLLSRECGPFPLCAPDSTPSNQPQIINID